MRIAALTVVAALMWLLTVQPARAELTLYSTAFSNHGSIPQQYSYDAGGCTGKNVSPPLSWRGAPANTRSYALTMFDPDARRGQGWWHWVVFNIPASAHGLPVNAGAGDGTSSGSLQNGWTDFQHAGYGGPCPPVGDPPHHYVLALYALDVTKLKGADDKTTGPALVGLLAGHILAKTTLIGRFGR